MMGDIAKGLKSFKEGMNDEDERARRGDDRRLPPVDNRPIDTTATRDTRPYDPAPPPPPSNRSDGPQG
jgi:sec-independent protein translocase protein TatA